MTDPNSTFSVRAKTMLTMPPDAPSLAHYEPDRVADREAEITGRIDDGTIHVVDGVVTYVGPTDHAPKFSGHRYDTELLMPGWIDCHTHSVFSGSREKEFVLRNAGRPYVEILESGGGILNTVDAVRETSRKNLTMALNERIYEFVRQGVTHLEVKSGYGLTTADETKMLGAVQDATPESPIDLSACFLGAHAIPRNFRDRREEYVDLVINHMIPTVAEKELATYCDVFCDRGAFTRDEAKRILLAGRDAGLIARIHADEITNAGAADLAAEIGAASADHLEHTTPDVFAKMADAGVVAVLMPAVNLFLGTTGELPDVRGMLDAGVEIAVATDFNPGSAMTQNLGLMTTLACTLYKITPGEALRAITVGAAKALQRDDLGTLQTGVTANLTMLRVPNPEYVPYHFGTSHIDAVVARGEFVYWTSLEPE